MVPGNLVRIDTVFTFREDYIYSVKFTTLDGRVKSFGKEQPNYGPGRVETFTLTPQERLLGAEIYHDGSTVCGVQWIKWGPS